MSYSAQAVQRISANLPPDAVPELVLDRDLDDERFWVPRGNDIWSLPLMFSVTQGSWVNITRARGEGVISRHRHSAPVTGYTLEGGYAEYMVADRRYVFPVSEHYDAVAAAPLLCAGLIGYRALRLAGDGANVGLYGFGAAAHILAQVLRHQGRQVFAFVRPGDDSAKAFAYDLGAVWAGASGSAAPEELDAAIIFAPVGDLVPLALKAVRPGGTVVCAGIHMSDIPSFPYDLLWRERRLLSVANLTRQDGEEFLTLAPEVPVTTTVEAFPLPAANTALRKLREGRLQGAAVLTMAPRP